MKFNLPFIITFNVWYTQNQLYYQHNYYNYLLVSIPNIFIN